MVYYSIVDLLLLGELMSNDISKGLQIPEVQAEAIKIKDGSAITNLMERDKNISILQIQMVLMENTRRYIKYNNTGSNGRNLRTCKV